MYIYIYMYMYIYQDIRAYLCTCMLYSNTPLLYNEVCARQTDTCR